MAYLYLKAVHIIFVVTWFAGLFYMPRLFIYNVEANEKPQPEQDLLHAQFKKMMRPLWYGITWPSAILTLILGLSVLISSGFYAILFKPEGFWLLLKLMLVLLLYGYHYSLHRIFKQQMNGIYKYTSDQLRMWNEVATVFLIAIVLLVVVKREMSVVWGLVGMLLLIFILMLAIRIYKRIRTKGK
ncbi:protoporphyrinogen IX oxidase [Niabella ginsenosidivorans]|uniref:Protoporphyrinogen IX oxidase n=1 Tax=Niabella ginsenosidivorans TaxID=1176587 RepID=A0A1A9IAA1_9BACT|nr:CopD family protein [Niabella ginsenosidivorans]ANH83484.1 protoporphyrinogen IX oxidase [Niabella ginsenosidivorans]